MSEVEFLSFDEMCYWIQEVTEPDESSGIPMRVRYISVLRDSEPKTYRHVLGDCVVLGRVGYPEAQAYGLGLETVGQVWDMMDEGMESYREEKTDPVVINVNGDTYVPVDHPLVEAMR